MAYIKIDTNTALAQLGGSEKLYKTVVNGFFDKYQHVDDEIKRLMDEGDLESAERMAHSIKGLSGNLGAGTLREKALALELTFKEKMGREASQTALDAFSRELADVVVEIKDMLVHRFNEFAGTEAKIIHHSEEVFTKQCEALIVALATYRYKEVQQAMTDLKSTQIPSQKATQVSIALKYIEDYDYDLAIESLRKLI